MTTRQPQRKPLSGSDIRNSILDMLARSGSWHSGEQLSATLGISRAAVAKHIAVLRLEGHAIDAAPRRGYALVARRDAIDGHALAAKLRTRVLGKGLWRVLEETDSTNLEAIRLAGEGVGEGAGEGAVVLAERQTHGRGRRGHTWLSLPRGLQFSVLLRPHSGPGGGQEGATALPDAGLLTHLAALCVVQAVEQRTGLRANYKAPNDVYLNGRKLSGVLVESGYRGTEPEWTVLGIGCNVNALAGDFPEEYREAFTSLLREHGAAVDRAALLADILVLLECCCTLLRRGETDPEAIISACRSSLASPHRHTA